MSKRAKATTRTAKNTGKNTGVGSSQPLLRASTPQPKQVRALRLNLTDGLTEAAQEIVALVPELAHIRLEQVHFTVFHSREAERTFTYARCYPLPQNTMRKGRRTYALTPVFTPQGKRALYLLAFAWERFWKLPPRARLETLVHELYHVGEAFDGEARNFGTGGWHGPGRKWFDQVIEDLCQRHLPEGFEYNHPVLSLELQPGATFMAEKLVRPKWEAVG